MEWFNHQMAKKLGLRHKAKHCHISDMKGRLTGSDTPPSLLSWPSGHSSHSLKDVDLLPRVSPLVLLGSSKVMHAHVSRWGLMPLAPAVHTGQPTDLSYHPPSYRDISQGRAAPVVSEEDGPLQKRQYSELPHKVSGRCGEPWVPGWGSFGARTALRPPGEAGKHLAVGRGVGGLPVVHSHATKEAPRRMFQKPQAGARDHGRCWSSSFVPVSEICNRKECLFPSPSSPNSTSEELGIRVRKVLGKMSTMKKLCLGIK